MDEMTSKKNGQHDIRKVKQAYRRSRKIRNWKKRHMLQERLVAAGLLSGALILLIVAGIGFLQKGRDGGTSSVTVQEPLEAASVRIGATGSFILHDAILESCAGSDGSYQFDPVFQYITPYYEELDFLTCEYEGTLAGEEAGYSGYPSFNAPDSIASSIRKSGVDLQLLATNHIYDMGSSGLRRTMDVLDRERICYTGIRQEDSDSRYYIADVKGIRIGWIDYTYETEGEGVNLNDISLDGEDAVLINTFDPDQLEDFYLDLEEQLEAMREDGAEFIILNMHWGIEYRLDPTPVQTGIAQRAAELGVDALIGGHPHCLEPVDVITGADGKHKMFVIYSVGNALSNQRKDILSKEMPEGHTEDGVLVELTLSRGSEGRVEITDVDIIPTWVYRSRLNAGTGTYHFYILPLDDTAHIEETTGLKDIASAAAESRDRTMAVLGGGTAKAKEIFAGES